MSLSPPPPCPDNRHLECLSWPDVQAAARRKGSTVIWPMGSIEQHGPHLPLGTDALFADRVVEEVIQRMPGDLAIWRLPLQSIGFAPEHSGFPGTLSLRAELLIRLIESVGADLARWGFRRLVLMNGHGGQIGLLEVAARQLRAEHPSLAVLPCFLWRGPEGLSQLIPEPERSEGLHAGLAETSLMLHLAPHLVRAQPLADGLHPALTPPEGWTWEGQAPTAWLTEDLSCSGVIGDPSEASANLGEKLFSRLVEGWEQRLQSLVRSEWPPSAKPGA